MGHLVMPRLTCRRWWWLVEVSLAEDEPPNQVAT
jgi:hypothetical protein